MFPDAVNLWLSVLQRSGNRRRRKEKKTGDSFYSIVKKKKKKLQIFNEVLRSHFDNLEIKSPFAETTEATVATAASVR